jgi:phosphoglycerate dehydrogenase-like enzyme
MKALLHYRASQKIQDRLRTLLPAWLDLVAVDEDDNDRLANELADTDVLLHVLEPVDAALLRLAPRLKMIQKIGVGLNTIDLEEARCRGVRVANMPGTNSQAVCEMSLALMFAAMRNIVGLDAATRAGRGWKMRLGALDDATEIHGKTVGLVGFGEVPIRLARVLGALGARVVTHTRPPFDSDLATLLPLADLLATSDVVSLHVPLDASTRHMINREALAQMKPGVVLINTARGGLIDQAALIDALRSGHVRAAGLDVLESEPATADCALFELPNVVVAPHVAWLTSETLDRSFEIIAENCLRLRSGEPLRFEIKLTDDKAP